MSKQEIRVNLDLLKKVGPVDAIVYAYIKHCESKSKEVDGFCPVTLEEIHETNNISIYTARRSVQTLTNLNLLESEMRGMPCKRYIKTKEIHQC